MDVWLLIQLFSSIQSCIVITNSRDSQKLSNSYAVQICNKMTRAWLIHRQHSPSGPIVGQSEPSAIGTIS